MKQFTFNTVIFWVFFKDFTQILSDIILIPFQISKSTYFLEHHFFSSLHGGSFWYYTTTDQMRDHGIIGTFRIFKVARIFDKNFGHDAYGVK